MCENMYDTAVQGQTTQATACDWAVKHCISKSGKLVPRSTHQVADCRAGGGVRSVAVHRHHQHVADHQQHQHGEA